MSLLKKLFQKKVNPQTDNQNISENSNNLKPRTQESGLSLASKIPDHYLPLWQLHKQRQLLEVRIGQGTKIYQSMIVALDIERGLLWLDDLFPQQRAIDVGDELIVRHHRNGEQLLIRAPIIALGANYGAAGIAILLPENASYSPRRTHPRFNLVSDSPTMVKIRTLGEEPCFGTLQDISAGGLRLQVPGNLLHHLRHGIQLPLCELSLGDNLQIRCRARVCAFRIARSPFRCTQISLEFVDLSDQKRQEIFQFLQRSQQNMHTQFHAA